MKSSIQKRLFKSFTLVILIVVVLLELFLSYGITEISYRNMERIMANNLDYAINSIVFRSDSLDVVEILDPSFRQYFDNNNAQVQIIDSKGMVIFDSLGVLYTEPIVYPDITDAKSGNRGVWSGNVDYSNEKVLAMSTPIINSTNQNIGVLRMIIGLEKLDGAIIKTISIFILFGLITILIALIISNYFAKSIVSPLRSLSDVAMKIADGQYKVRSEVDTNDEIEQLSDSINYMAEELVKRETLKNDFISSVSHELRTPLTSIKGWAITIQNAKDMGQQFIDEGLKIIVGETDRLSAMVEDLLDFSKFTSGKITLRKEEVDTREFLNSIIKQMQPRINNEGHVFSIDLADDLGQVALDKDRIRQVFINVFDNSIKFTEEPGVISLYGRKNNLNQLILSIKDTGSGIEESDIRRVKEKFFKGNLGKSHTGLGLSISDEIMNLHGGELVIASEVGKGTTVTIILPVEKVGGV